MRTLFDLASTIATSKEDEEDLKLVAKCVADYLRTRMNMLQPEIKIKSIGKLVLKKKYEPEFYEKIKETMVKNGHKVWNEEEENRIKNFYNKNGTP